MTTLKFTKQRKGRKQLAAFLATQLRATVEYLGTPTFAYQIGEAMLDRDWLLHLPDDTDTAGLVEAAAQAGFPADAPVAEELGLTLVFPTTDWNEATAGKVEATLAAKGRLIATALQIPATPIHLDEQAGKAEFDWFDEVPGREVVEAASLLIARIIDHAKTATRVSAKPAETDGNDKYAMRCWLLRLGLIGDDTKPVRRTLLKHLDGNAAWRTPPTRTPAMNTIDDLDQHRDPHPNLVHEPAHRLHEHSAGGQ